MRFSNKFDENSVIKRMKYYMENYNFFTYIDTKDKINYTTSTKDRSCRFCKKKFSKKEFSKKAHAIPELLGNKNIISKDECDECNEFFGKKLEDSLSKFLGLERNIHQILGKNGIPSYMSNNKAIRIDEVDGKIIVQQQIKGKEAIKIDKEKKEIILHEDGVQFCPIAIYKALVKIGISILPPEELEYFQDTINWLKENNHSNSMKSYAFILVKYIPRELRDFYYPLKVIGFIRKNNDFFKHYYQVLIEFRNNSYQFKVPCKNKECIVLKNDEIILPAIPGTHETEDFIGISQVVSRVEILSEHNKITTSGRDFRFKYEKFEDIPINNKKYDELLQELNVPRKKWLNKK